MKIFTKLQEQEKKQTKDMLQNTTKFHAKRQKKANNKLYTVHVHCSITERLPI